MTIFGELMAGLTARLAAVGEAQFFPSPTVLNGTSDAIEKASTLFRGMRDDVIKGEPLMTLLEHYDHEVIAVLAAGIAKADTAGPSIASPSKTALHGATSAALLHLATHEYLLALCAARAAAGGPTVVTDRARAMLKLAAAHGRDIDDARLRAPGATRLELSADIPLGDEPADPELLAADRETIRESTNGLLAALSDQGKALDRVIAAQPRAE